MCKEEQEAMTIVHTRAKAGFNQNYKDQDTDWSGF